MDISPISRNKIPELERSYKNRQGEYFKLTQSKEKGKYLVATRDIETGDVIFIEDFLLVVPLLEVHPSLHSNIDYQILNHKVSELEKECGNSKKLNHSSEQVVHRLLDFNSAAYMLASPNIDEICKLEDVHRDAQVGEIAVVDGLVSEAGKKLNGRRGKVAKEDAADPGRVGVDIPVAGKSLVKSIKKSNLKTLCGIARTNGISWDDHLCFGAVACRMNHACADAANVKLEIFLDIKKIFVTASRPISRGEDILFDYQHGSLDFDKRRQMLQSKYKFWCQCSMHSANRPPGPVQDIYKIMQMQESGASDDDILRWIEKRTAELQKHEQQSTKTA